MPLHGSSSRIQTVTELDEALSLPTAGVLETLRCVPGDIMVLGAGGKMGPTLARMVRRGFDTIGMPERRVFAVSRFSSPRVRDSLQRLGVTTIACDLMDRSAVNGLPECPNVIAMAGQKFGTNEAPELTWATNAVIPTNVAERFSRSRIVAMSTGCVYPLVATSGPGSREGDPLTPPGEYANSCVGRERVFEYFSKRYQTPLALVRLCYAIDLRYGVLLDLAQKVFRGDEIDLSMGATHVIWQGDANARIIQSLEHVAVPATPINVTGLERLSIRNLAERLGELLGRPLNLIGAEAPTAWLWDAQRSYDWFGPPLVSIEQMLEWIADWVRDGGETLNRPTHFEVRDGKY
ncbi:MAG: NAD(P)-dependent oxidoreductase [Planctomycetota bacterium]